MVLIGTGREVSLRIEAFEQLESEGACARIVSMASGEFFAQHDKSYRDKVLPPSVSARISVEAGLTIGWNCQVEASGEKIGMRGFDASAPIADLLKEFRFTRETAVAAARRRLDFPEKSP
ncbi:hypothetical protein [uncultured Rhodoblastus sp.]|uniref:transketolase-like TK C-terminal-containing protein n=1 Tax=uncultured Rhodoblastus sp. TaxID=543037 RepID=UPI0025E81033|nr:hypothetical protein [uncultured Rhodoblastus sp.]